MHHLLMHPGNKELYPKAPTVLDLKDDDLCAVLHNKSFLKLSSSDQSYMRSAALPVRVSGCMRGAAVVECLWYFR